jgi:hypothetical protein
LSQKQTNKERKKLKKEKNKRRKKFGKVIRDREIFKSFRTGPT